MKPARELHFKTYDEWDAVGYYVCLGEKSIKRNAQGVAVFSEEQVRRKPLYFEDPYWKGVDSERYVDGF